jgi:outer membrane receptor protein involved in Fe transport
VTLYGKNLGDERGITNYANVSTVQSLLTVIQPRTIGVTLSAKF